VFFSQAVEAADEAKAAYYRQHTDQGNAGERSHMYKEEEEDVFLSQAADEAEATYYR
jgi:hypothetical protein